MNICEPFIRRPVMTTLVMASFFIFGVFGFLRLPVSDLPNIDFPTIAVNAVLPGASPETMASGVATPLEQHFSTIAGIDSMTSSSVQGQATIIIQFHLDRNIDSAAQDIQAAISAASKALPPELPSPPNYKKVNPADAPILYLAVSSSILPLSTVNYYAETLLAQRISMVSGVAQVNVLGSQKYAVRVQINPEIAASYDLGLDELRQNVANNNVNFPTGALIGEQRMLPIQTNGQIMQASGYRPLIVTYRKGAPIRLQDVGRVIDSVENNQVASWYNKDRAIILAIQRQPGTNTLAVVKAIKNILPTFEDQIPKSIKIDTLYDRSISIRASVEQVETTLLIAAVLVILVIFVFLRNISVTIIPSVALPLSIIGTFGVMSFLNFSLNIVSLMALTLVVGFVVDDAIVMLENITRHMEQGESPFEAAIKGSKEIGFTILSMTLSLVAVFIPLLFMPGLLGRLFHEFAVTTTVAILLSGIISLTLTPMMASRLLKPASISLKASPWFQLSDRWFQRSLSWYEESLKWVLENRRFTFGVFALTVVLVGVLFVVIPKGFIPSQDLGQILVFTEADPGIGFAAMVEKQQKVVDIIRQDPEVGAIMSSVGAGGASLTTNTGRIFLRLKPHAERSHTADEIIQRLRRKVDNVPGINVYLQNIATVNVGGRISKSVYQYTLQDGNLAELRHWAAVFQDEFSRLRGLQDVTNDLQMATPDIRVDIDRDKAGRLGITAADIERTLSDAFGTQIISTIYAPITTYDVVMEVLPELQQDPKILSQLYVRSANNSLVPLTAVATFTPDSQPLAINHQGQLPAATISFNLKPNVSLSEAVKQINRVKQKLRPPVTLFSGFQGTAQIFKESQQGMGLLLFLAVLVIYIVLGILYESFIHPLTILSGLPAAAIGALLTLMLFNIDLDLYGFIGIIMLVGIVKKNAIMMIDFAIAAQREQNKTPEEAIYQACVIRFRPIMMTTMAALLGALPIALAQGEGSEPLRPLGLAVVGGLLLSQFLTLFITPVIYLYLENFQKTKEDKEEYAIS